MRRFVDRVTAASCSAAKLHPNDEAPRNTALSSPGDFDVPGEGSSGRGVSFSGAYNTRERANDRCGEKFILF